MISKLDNAPRIPSVLIVHFQRFCKELCSLNDKPFIKSKANQPDFLTKLGEIFSKITLIDEIKYDAIYIDESQDFAPDWLGHLYTHYVKRDSDKKQFYMSGDDAQNIYNNRSFASQSGFS